MSNSIKRRNLLKSTFGLLAAGPFLSGCERPTQANQILVGVTTRPRMLDPRRATDALSSRVNRLLYRQLIDFNERSEPVADLADWQAFSTQHYRFTLREASMFKHGKTLQAEDVAATYQSILDVSFGSPHRGPLKHIARIDVLNESTLDFHLSEPDALFVGRLTVGILPKDLIDAGHDFTDQPLGSGQATFIEMNEQRLILQRPDRVELHFVVVKDAMVRVLKLQKGELDCLQNDLSPELVQYCESQPGLVVSWQKGTSYSYIGFNFDDPLLSQPALREAIAYTIDRQQIINAIFNGQARLAGGLLVPEHWAGHSGLSGWPHDLEKARILISQVEFEGKDEGKPLVLSYKTSSDPTRIRLATLYQAQLKRVGIELQIQSYDWGTFYSDIVQGRFQMFGLAWVGIKSPDIFQYVFASDAIPPNGANRGRYRSEQADQLIQQAGQADTLEQQAELYRQLQSHLQQTLPILPLWYENQYAVTQAHLQGYQLFADGRLDSLLWVQKKVG
ncbi:ABC transporter substrate-binding protein [Thiomicrospira sp.]|uniref:ABC transporter substrate-binding protein n=1 Tax=Thiomicrospira sp. TaxID=935 RepID=UPI002F94D976